MSISETLFLSRRLWLRFRNHFDDFAGHRIDQKNLIFSVSHSRSRQVPESAGSTLMEGHPASRLSAVWRQFFGLKFLAACVVLSLNSISVCLVSKV
jgi:hypothetical protein